MRSRSVSELTITSHVAVSDVLIGGGLASRINYVRVQRLRDCELQKLCKTYQFGSGSSYAPYRQRRNARQRSS